MTRRELPYDDQVDALAEAFPVLTVTPTAFGTGPFDPGGAYARIAHWLWLAALALVVARCRQRTSSR